MIQFEEIDPETINHNPNVVGSQVDDIKPNRTFYILAIDSYIVVVVCKYWINNQTGAGKWLSYQIEFPKAGLPWFVKTLVEKFLKLSHDGGLPFGVYHFKEDVDGEELKINRSMGGREGNSGYTLSTLSRTDDVGFAKNLTFSDVMLFEQGLFEKLKVLAERIESGEL